MSIQDLDHAMNVANYAREVKRECDATPVGVLKLLVDLADANVRLTERLNAVERDAHTTAQEVGAMQNGMSYP